MTSQLSIDRYSALAEEQETVLWFLVFQENGLEPEVVKYPVVEQRVFGELAQSESE